jgi:hypothetical protein
MKYYSYNKYSYNVHGDVEPCVVTYTESEILDIYWDWWKEEGIKRWGKEHFEANYSEKDCIEDWVVVNWAQETTVDVPQETL